MTVVKFKIFGLQVRIFVIRAQNILSNYNVYSDLRILEFFKHLGVRTNDIYGALKKQCVFVELFFLKKTHLKVNI